MAIGLVVDLAPAALAGLTATLFHMGRQGNVEEVVSSIRRDVVSSLVTRVTRRGLLLGAGATTLALATPAIARSRTPSATEGPFYPRRLPLDKDADLTRVSGRSGQARGTVLELTGRVIDVRGNRVDGALVEIWQCDAYGSYHHVGSAGHVNGRIDLNFQGYGRTKTLADGGFRFRTIRPETYPGRTPHIHVNVSGAGLGKLTSQLYIDGHPGNERDFLFRSLGTRAAKQSVSMKLRPGSETELKTDIQIVVGA